MFHASTWGSVIASIRGAFAPTISFGRAVERRQQHGIVHRVKAACEGHPLAGEQLPDDRERLLETRDVVVEREPKRTELDLVPPGAEGGDEPAAAQLADRCRLPRKDPGRMERRAGDEWAERDALGDRGQRRQRRPAIPRASLPPTAAVEQVISHPERVEATPLRGARHRCKLRPAHLALDLRELDPNPQALDAHAQKRSNAGGSEGTAVISCQTPPVWPISKTWSMSSSRPSRRPLAR